MVLTVVVRTEGRVLRFSVDKNRTNLKATDGFVGVRQSLLQVFLHDVRIELHLEVDLIRESLQFIQLNVLNSVPQPQYKNEPNS
jgi:hypothetical protein